MFFFTQGHNISMYQGIPDSSSEKPIQVEIDSAFAIDFSGIKIIRIGSQLSLYAMDYDGGAIYKYYGNNVTVWTYAGSYNVQSPYRMTGYYNGTATVLFFSTLYTWCSAIDTAAYNEAPSITILQNFTAAVPTQYFWDINYYAPVSLPSPLCTYTPVTIQERQLRQDLKRLIYRHTLNGNLMFVQDLAAVAHKVACNRVDCPATELVYKLTYDPKSELSEILGGRTIQKVLVYYTLANDAPSAIDQWKQSNGGQFPLIYDRTIFAWGGHTCIGTGSTAFVAIAIKI